jgi:putative sterol carrier protein
MSTEPITFLSKTLPEIFNRGVSLLRTKAESDEKAKTHLEDVLGASGVGRVVITDVGEVWLAVNDGVMSYSAARPEGVPVRLAVEFPSDATEIVLGEASREGAFDDDRAAIGATHLSSKKLETALTGKTMTTHLTIKDAPDLGDVVIKLGFNVEAPPEKPGFTGEIKYDDLEALREGKLLPQQLFMGGKLRLKGDYSLALQLAMQLSQPPKQPVKK